MAYRLRHMGSVRGEADSGRPVVTPDRILSRADRLMAAACSACPETVGRR
jgi:hypothetical protein